MKTVEAWDLPTRLFHWILAVLILCAYLSYEYGDVQMKWHMWNGYAILTLCLYRVLWGILGSSTARFGDFVRGPRRIWGYVLSLRNGQEERYLGHNPLGACMVLALLLLILGQGSLGLFTSDDIFVDGPLVFLASSDWVSFAGSLHRIGFWVIVGFVSLHILAALFYVFVKRENLVRAMVNGRKPVKQAPSAAQLQKAPLHRALFLLLFSAGVIWLSLNIWSF